MKGSDYRKQLAENTERRVSEARAKDASKSQERQAGTAVPTYEAPSTGRHAK